MKKLLIAALFATLIFPSCGDDDDEVEPTPQNNNQENVTPDTPGNNDDNNKTDDDNKNNENNKTDEDNKNIEITIDDVEIPADRPRNMKIFLCFGQSNMEGNAAVEDQDRQNVPNNMLNMIVAKDDAKHYGQSRYTWRKADPPLARYTTGLTPADYFGRKLCEYLPQNDTIGIVMVAIGGSAIEGFDKDKCESYYKSIKLPNDGWLKGYFDQYDANPYKVLVKAAKVAQQYGKICGILLHQGESNNGQSDWPNKVKKIYNDLVSDLGLDPSECPLLAGETLREDMGGCCSWHNTVIAKLPNVLPNSYVISSESCPGKDDALHFLASGYRTIGRRYAYKMLELMNIPYEEEVEEILVDEDTDPAGKVAKEDAFDFSKFDPSIWDQGTYDADTKTFQTGQYGFAGWHFDEGADFSSAKYLVVDLDPSSAAIGTYEFSFRLYDKDVYIGGNAAIFRFGSNSTVKIDLENMRGENGKRVYPTHIFYAGFWTMGGSDVIIKDIRFEN